MSKQLGHRHARKVREGRAVSPVVATLILILVAVAAAAALYLWLVAWQSNVTKGIGTTGPQSTVTIGGSTSVYPFDQQVVTQFEQNNTAIVISNNQGGSGAGMLAVCAGQVDIGATSSLQTPANLEANFGCPSAANNAPVVTTVAYDGVDPIVAVANTHGLISVNWDTLLTVYALASSSTPTLGGAWSTSAGYTVNGVAPVVTTALHWNQIPACAAGATCNGVAFASGLTVGAGTPVACTGGFSCNSYTGTSPCGWTVCAGGANNLISTVSRSDISGTTQSFTARLLAVGSGNKPVATLSALSSNFGGCGSDGQLGSCGIATTTAANGNPGVISAVAANPDAIGYASDGLARLSTSGVSCAGVATAACGIGVEGVGQTAAVQASLGSSGSISSAIKTGLTATTGYVGWRPFQWVTLGAPTGEVQRLLQFAMIPANNINFASESDEISVYSV